VGARFPWFDYEVFSPLPADINTHRWMKKLAADVLEKLKEKHGEFVWINWDDVDELRIDFLVSRLTESSSTKPNAIEL